MTRAAKLIRLVWLILPASVAATLACAGGWLQRIEREADHEAEQARWGRAAIQARHAPHKPAALVAR